LSGSLGLGGSLNAGTTYAMAQASHGSAPDIAGKNIANPFSLILSAALLLAWQGRREGKTAFEAASRAIETAVEAAIAAHDVTGDIGGRLGTREAASALADRIRNS
jgi:3-isopropylmalate dehydrogenase